MEKRLMEGQPVASSNKQEAGMALKGICPEIGGSARSPFTIENSNMAKWKPAM